MAWAAAAQLLLLLAALCARAGAQTYTNENIAALRAYSAFPGQPTASTYAPYLYAAPPASASCTGVGGTCVPVTVAGSAEAGYWLVRGGTPYWIKCVQAPAPHAAGALVCVAALPPLTRAQAPRTRAARGTLAVSRGTLAPTAAAAVTA